MMSKLAQTLRRLIGVLQQKTQQRTTLIRTRRGRGSDRRFFRKEAPYDDKNPGVDLKSPPQDWSLQRSGPRPQSCECSPSQQYAAVLRILPSAPEV
jgi:hypothetical protein